MQVVSEPVGVVAVRSLQLGERTRELQPLRDRPARARLKDNRSHVSLLCGYQLLERSYQRRLESCGVNVNLAGGTRRTTHVSCTSRALGAG